MSEIRRAHHLEHLEARTEQAAGQVASHADQLAQLRAEFETLKRSTRQIAGENLALKLEINVLSRQLGEPTRYPELPTNPPAAFGLIREPDQAEPATPAAPDEVAAANPT